MQHVYFTGSHSEKVSKVIPPLKMITNQHVGGVPWGNLKSLKWNGGTMGTERLKAYRAAVHRHRGIYAPPTYPLKHTLTAVNHWLPVIMSSSNNSSNFTLIYSDMSLMASLRTAEVFKKQQLYNKKIWHVFISQREKFRKKSFHVSLWLISHKTAWLWRFIVLFTSTWAFTEERMLAGQSQIYCAFIQPFFKVQVLCKILIKKEIQCNDLLIKLFYSHQMEKIALNSLTTQKSLDYWRSPSFLTNSL